MKAQRFISILLANLLIIFGLAFLIIKILDRYNPLMNFSGQSEFLQISLCLCAVISGVFRIFSCRSENREIHKDNTDRTHG